jgi:hypothetical protein
MDTFLTICNAALGLVLTFIGIELTMNPVSQDDRRKIWIFRILFTFFGIGVCVLAGIQSHRASQSDDSRQAIISDLRGRISVMEDRILHPVADPQHAQLQTSINEIAKRLRVAVAAASPSQPGSVSSSGPTALAGLSNSSTARSDSFFCEGT